MPKRNRNSNESPQLAKLLVTKQEAEERIKTRISKGEELLQRPINNESDLENTRADYFTWNEYNQELLRRTFDNESILENYRNYAAIAILGMQSVAAQIKDVHDDINTKIRRLSSIVDQLELFSEPDTISSVNEKYLNNIERNEREIFIVHGSDDAARESVARFIEKLKLVPIILKEQPNSGRTIIEKFEESANVGYAVVLLTPDDVGARATEQQSLQLRARQNVIFELGFFVGSLGRGRVCALYKNGVEIPSDFYGVAYIQMDTNDGWMLGLAKEMKAANIDFDLSKVV